MKRTKLILISFSILVSFTVVTGCQTTQKAPTKALINSIATGCETEIKSYCSQVTPGEGRILACLYSHREELSIKCKYMLLKAAPQLERVAADLSYVVDECENDIEQYCSTVIAGEGRLFECLLEDNRDKISNRCSQAIKDAGLE